MAKQTNKQTNKQKTLKNVENEKCTLQDMEYGEKTYKRGNRETHMVGHYIWRETLKNGQNEKHNYRNLNMLRKLTNEENEKVMVGPRIWREN